jgi:fumarate reductase subunit D
MNLDGIPTVVTLNSLGAQIPTLEPLKNIGAFIFALVFPVVVLLIGIARRGVRH